MTVLVNSFEGGTNTTVITTGNGGGASGNAFDSIGGSPTFSSTQAAHGSLSCEVSVSSSTAYVAWTTSLGSQATVYFRQYFYIPSNPSGTIYLTKFTQPGIVTCASVMLEASGQLAFWDTNGTARITSTESVPLNAWFRIEGFVTGNASTGQLALNIYNSMDSRVVTETHTSAATLNTFGTISGFDAGLPTSTTFTYWLDDIGLSTQGFLGPVGSPPLTNSFEGGTNGTTITTGNSGGGSGNAFDTVTIPGGSTVTYSNTVSAHGTLSSAVATTTDTSSLYVQWDVSEGTQTTIYFRAYCYLPASSSGNWRPFAAESSNTHAASFFFAAGVLKTSYGSAFTNGPVFTTAIPTNQWIRIEGYVTGDPSVGALSVSLYTSMDSIVPNEVHSVSGINTTGALTQYRFGQNAATANSGPYYLDDIGVSSTGYLGPSNIAIVYPQTGPVSAKGTGFPSRGRISSNAGSLPPLLLQNSFDGGTNGTTVTTGNSGGVSGNAFTSVNIGATSVLAYSNTTYASGSLSAVFSNGGTPSTDFLEWSPNVIGVQPKLWFRVCFFFTANPTSNTQFIRATTNNFSVINAVFFINASGKITIFGEAVSVNSIPLNQWFRIEGYIYGPSAGGQASYSLFATPDSQVPTETQTAAATTGGPTDDVRFGNTSGTSNTTTFYLDSIGVSNTGYLGPVSYTAEPSTGMPGSVVAPRIPQNGPRGRSSGTVPKIIQLTNNFNSGATGSALTSGSSGNTGTSGNYFDTIGASGGTIAFSNSFSAHGSLSAEVSVPTSGDTAYARWDTSLRTESGEPLTQMWFREYLYFTAIPSAGAVRVFTYTDIAGNNCSTIFVNPSTGHLQMTGNAGTLFTFTTPIPVNQWFRIEGYVVNSTTGGYGSLSLFRLKDSVIPTETHTSAATFNTLAGGTGVWFGIAFSSSANSPYWIDDVGISNTGYLGPSGLPSGATFIPQQYPIQAKGNGLPPRGRIASNPGALVPVLLTNSFEGGTNGTTISTGNSGGVSGSPFSSVTIGSGGSLTYSNSEYAHGGISSEFSTSTTASSVYLRWGEPTFGVQANVWFRFYAYLTAFPSVNLHIWYAGSGGFPQASLLAISPAGKLLMTNAAAATVITSSNSIPLNQWFRVEGYVLNSSSNATISVSLFDSPDAQVSVETVKAANVNTGGPIVAIEFGLANNVANVGPFWLDDLGLSNTGPLGPVSFPGDASSGIPGTAIQVRIPQNGPRGRIGSNAGGPLRNPVPLISWRTGASVEGAGSGLSQTITIPSSVQAGDIVFLVANAGVGGSSEPSLSVSSTGTLPVILGNQVQTYNGSISLTGALWWFTASATDAGKVITVTSTITTTWGLALGAWYSTSPIRIDVAPAPNSILSGTSITAPVATTSAYGDWALYFEVNTTGAALTSNPGILRESILRAGISDSGSSVGASKTVIGGGTWASGGGSDNWIAFTVGITAGAAIVYPQEIPAQAKNIGLPARGRVYSNPGSLPALLLLNNFDGGTNGVTITTANSGGASGNAFTAVAIGATDTLTFSNTTYATGSLSAQIVNGATNNTSNFFWTTKVVGLQPKLWFRICCYFTALPTGTPARVFEFFTFFANKQVGALEINLNGTITLKSSSPTITTSVSTIPLNQWFRIEGWFVASLNAGQASVSLFATPESQVPIETNTSAANVNTSGSIQSAAFGYLTNTANFTYYLDSVGISNIGYLGPTSYIGQASSGMPGTSHQSRYKQPARGRIVSNAQKATIPPVLRSLTFSLGIPYTQWTAGSATTQWRVS